MKIVTAEQMREIDRRTIEDGVPGIALMENAAHRVVEELIREFDPIDQQNIVIFCGKGNNGGDGLAIARILREYNVGRLRVILAADSSEYSGDSAANLKRLPECGVFPTREVPEKLRDRREVNIVIDALLGTGLSGPPTGRVAELIRATKTFPQARVVAIDLPSGLGGAIAESGDGSASDIVRADITVTFTSPKVEHYLANGAEEHVGRLVISQIGTPPWLIPSGLEVGAPGEFRHLFLPRKRDGHKGKYGHVLVVGGAEGKSGAATMTGLAALRSGAGLVSVTSREATLHAPELMTESLDGFALDRKSVVAVGPGLGMKPELLARLLKEVTVPMVIDADGLNSIAGTPFRGRGVETILTPHPGEMSRLTGLPVEKQTLVERLSTARSFAQERNVCVVLKGYRTLIAMPDGNVWINTSGSPGMATAGTGDILTGMIAGMVASTMQQFPEEIGTAVRAAVWLHGRAGELGADELTEQCLIATDLLRYLPAAIREVAPKR
ncbi:MAG: NAD(P)H-hydrate dehydratase [Acidobacteriota bacterium]